MMETIKLSASCALGVEKVLASELERLGVETGARAAGRVGFTADKAGLARTLVGCRTADRIFVTAGSFPARDFDALFEGVRAIPWERWVGKNDRLVVEKARSARSNLSAQNALQAVTLKAAYERLCARYGVVRMPEIGPTLSARIRIERDEAVVELDVCGEALSRRGYRKRPTDAPLKESLAAAALFMVGWRSSLPLYDPFCGSGTIPIEAALYAMNLAPGLGRRFAWEGMPDGGTAELAAAREAARAAARLDREFLVAGSDADERAIEAAVANAGMAGVADRIRLTKCQAGSAAPFAAKGVVLTDPPYGKRLGTREEADALYESLAPFADRFSAWELCFVVDRDDFGGFTGRPGRRTKIVDGAETRWLHRFPARETGDRSVSS